jgi:hypothetical protein
VGSRFVERFGAGPHGCPGCDHVVHDQGACGRLGVVLQGYVAGDGHQALRAPATHLGGGRPAPNEAIADLEARAGREARLAAPIAVTVRAPAPSVVTLVDDVHTTGATLHFCATALQTCGAAEVRAITYARTLR